MQPTKLARLILIAITLLSLVALCGNPQPSSLGLGVQSVAAQGGTPPTTLIGSGVTSYSVASPKLFWRTAAECPPPQPGLTSPDAAPAAEPQAAADPEIISRISVYGSETRQLWTRNDPRPAGQCNQYKFRSNIIADDQHVYWVDDTGLVRLPVNANPGDVPEQRSSPIASSTPIELAQSGGELYMLINGSSNTSADLYFGFKSISGFFVINGIGSGARALSAVGDDVYVLINGVLTRRNPGTTDPVLNIATGVSAYHAEGEVTTCPNIECFTTKYVYYAKGGRQVFRYNQADGQTATIYTSADSTANVFAITGTPPMGTISFGGVYLFERRSFNCGSLFCSYNEVLLRTSRTGSASSQGSPLYVYGAGPYPSVENLTTDGTFVFWHLWRESQLLRLPADADALAQTNMRITDIEVTQGVQRLNNSVLLVRNRNTYVRVHVRADGPSVDGVTAILTGSWDGGSGGPLNPINNTLRFIIGGTTRITVPQTPSRLRVDDSFLFQLPWEWTRHNNLRLTAVLNPYKYPLQQSYANNTRTVGPFTFRASPRLAVELISFGYKLNNTTYYPREKEDVQGNIDWIRRVYPLASTAGGFNDATPGFRPNTRSMLINDLGTYVDQSNDECDKLITYKPDGSVDKDDRNLCASGKLIEVMGLIRFFSGIDANTYVYGMISDAGQFARGQANGRSSIGPTGDSWLGYYAGHEIGHMLGQGHPATGNGECNLEGSDPDPAYPHAHIGPDDESVAGFNPGTGLFRAGRAVMGANTPGNTWFDMMAYCQPEWISDTNYTNLFNAMSALNAEAATLRQERVGPLQGDWLGVFGTIVPNSDNAIIGTVRRAASVADVPPLTPGAYSIRLLDGQNQALADYPFTPSAADDSPLLPYGQVVPFVAGTTQLQIVRTANGRVLASQAVSGNQPTVTDVTLGGEQPITGEATVSWSASDPDGDTLSYDLLYSRDGGASFFPLEMSLTTTSATFDTSRLAGSTTAVLRVVANDGVNSTQADSAPFTMAAKPPQPRILEVDNNTTIHYGQLVNLSGEATDAQDGTVAATSLVWTNQKGETLGTGALLSLTNLPVGSNQITLTATNSAGLTGSTSITILVDDNLALPGPVLGVDPTSLNWHIPADTTTVQTADLSITNSGGGSLDWTATSDAPWITLSAASGEAPATLTVSADPSGMVNGTTRTGNVVITTGEGATAQTTTIPVTLALGNTLDPPTPTPSPTTIPTATTVPPTATSTVPAESTPTATTPAGSTPTATTVPGNTATATTPPVTQQRVYLPVVRR